MTTPAWRLGFDIGGTFTDFVLQNAATGAVVVGKELTTPADPPRRSCRAWKPCSPPRR
jgi:5-oxoprolinase (ATP-hydrolysing)